MYRCYLWQHQMTILKNARLYFFFSHDSNMFYYFIIEWHCIFVLNIPTVVQRWKTTTTVTVTDSYFKALHWPELDTDIVLFVDTESVSKGISLLDTANMPVLDQETSKDLGGGNVNILYLTYIYVWIYFIWICMREIMFYNQLGTSIRLRIKSEEYMN